MERTARRSVDASETGEAGPDVGTDASERSAPYNGECYCGLGPACHFWREFTPEERLICTRDKRMTAQYYWKAGV